MKPLVMLLGLLKTVHHLVRIPASRGLSTRIEVRSVDPSANPYLAMAVILEAGLDGIRKRLTPPAPVDRNIYVMNAEERKENGIDNLPAQLDDALRLLEKDEVVLMPLVDIFMKTLKKQKK